MNWDGAFWAGTQAWFDMWFGVNGLHAIKYNTLFTANIHKLHLIQTENN